LLLIVYFASLSTSIFTSTTISWEHYYCNSVIILCCKKKGHLGFYNLFIGFFFLFFFYLSFSFWNFFYWCFFHFSKTYFVNGEFFCWIWFYGIQKGKKWRIM